MGTYAYAGKPMFEIPVPSRVDFASPADKDFSSARNRFIWLGSSGLVHKGLDVALEAFAEMPECHLSVCGPLDAASERRFVDLYRSELYELPNVSAVGWVNVREPAFQALVAGSVGLIYPSCAEGQSGAVVTCLRAGLIPIVSHESGVDVGDFGFELRDCSVEEIKRRVTAVSQLPEDALSGMSMRAWEHGNRVHGKAHYVETFGQMIRQIEAERGAPARQR
jgi:glycosyltransferase involved in cell wall biosynthesis